MEDKPDNPVLIAGCGYVGRRVARLLGKRGRAVTGLVRSAASAGDLAGIGIETLQGDLDLDPPPSLAGFRDIFYFAPPPGDGDRDTRMTRVLAALGAPRRIVYISTSAVYGDCSGAWIDEDQPVNPTNARGRRRLDAERQLSTWALEHCVQWIILRVPGIYGPGKLPLARLRQGLPVLREEEAPYTNRIHGDDLAAICVAAMYSDKADTVYNVSDGHPGNMTDYFFRVADAAGLPRPPVVARDEADAVLSAGMLSFLNDSRRMRNDRLLNALGIELQYPDLESGLKSCFRG
ncbi:MAG: SDR family oxidoreductase [Gammaproteobacteria bacterium]